MVQTVENRIAASEHLANTSKSNSGLMPIAPNPTGLSSLKNKETVVNSKEKYDNVATSSPLKSNQRPESRGEVSVFPFSLITQDAQPFNVEQEEDRNDITGLEKLNDGTGEKNIPITISEDFSNKVQNHPNQNLNSQVEESCQGNDCNNVKSRHDQDELNKSFKDILEEEEKILYLDEEGPVIEINVSNDQHIYSNRTRDDDTVSPLSFMHNKIDARRENQPYDQYKMARNISFDDELNEPHYHLHDIAAKQSSMNVVHEEAGDKFASCDQIKEFDCYRLRPVPENAIPMQNNQLYETSNETAQTLGKAGVEDDSRYLDYFENLLPDEPSLVSFDNKSVELKHQKEFIQEVKIEQEIKTDNTYNNYKDSKPYSSSLESKFDDLRNAHEDLKSSSSPIEQKVGVNDSLEKRDFGDDPKSRETNLKTDRSSRSLLSINEDDVLTNSNFVQISDYENATDTFHEQSKRRDQSPSAIIEEKHATYDAFQNHTAQQNPVDNNDGYTMSASPSFEDDLRPVETVSFENNHSKSESESDLISETTPFAGIKYVGDFVHNSSYNNDEENPGLKGNDEKQFSYLSPSSDEHSNQNHLPLNFPTRSSEVQNKISSNQDSNNHIILQQNTSHSNTIPQQNLKPLTQNKTQPHMAPIRHHSTSGPPLTYKNSNSYFQYDDGISLGISVLTEETFGTNANQRQHTNDDLSVVYSVSDKSHVSSTSISQGGLKPKRRPSSSNSDPSKPIAIFRTASALRDKPALYNTNSMISELTGMDSNSDASIVRRTSYPGTTKQLATINNVQAEASCKEAPGRRETWVSPFEQHHNTVIVSNSHTSSSLHQNSFTNNQNPQSIFRRKDEKKRFRFSLRSLSPWRKVSEKSRRNKEDDSPYEFSNKKEETMGRSIRGRSRTRMSIQKTPSQILLEDEIRETTVPLVAVNPSQNSNIETPKPRRRFSLRSLSPFARHRRNKSSIQKMDPRADPFDDENNSLHEI